MGFRVLTVAAVLLGWALPLRAQQPVELQFDTGLVTLSAQNVPVRTILAEWARMGGATIVNGDRVVGPPVTIELNGVPEQQALGIILRSVAGYVLAPVRIEQRVGIRPYPDPGYQRRAQESPAAGGRVERSPADPAAPSRRCATASSGADQRWAGRHLSLRRAGSGGGESAGCRRSAPRSAAACDATSAPGWLGAS